MGHKSAKTVKDIITQGYWNEFNSFNLDNHCTRQSTAKYVYKARLDLITNMRLASLVLHKRDNTVDQFSLLSKPFVDANAGFI